MPPGAYPNRTAVFWLEERELQPEYMVTKSPPFADGGHDFNLDADDPIRRWEILYDGDDEAVLAPLDTHVADAKYSDDAGSFYGFDFTTRTGELVSSVHYDKGGYQRSQTKTYSQRRVVRLVKYP